MAFYLTFQLTYILALYLTFFLAFHLTCYLDYIRTFFLAYFLALYLTCILISSLRFDILSGILLLWHSIYITFYIFGPRSAPQHPELATWSSGPGVLHSIRSSLYRDRPAQVH